MPVVAVTGSRSGAGKTRFIERLLDACAGAAVIKGTPEERGPGIVDDPEILRVPGTDTARFLSAGAGTVLWVRSGRETLETALGDAVRRAGPGLVIVESGAAFRVPGVFLRVFVDGGPDKPGAPDRRAAADRVVSDPFDAMDGVVRRIQEVVKMSEDRARALIRERQKDGRLSCAELFRISEEADVSKKRMGELMNELDYKVVHCQLGCFP